MKQLEASLSTVLRYLDLQDCPAPCDYIIGFGSHCVAVPRRAAHLFHSGFVPKIVFCGGPGGLTGEIQGSEAAWLRDVALREGVPADCISLEERSSNVLENVLFVRTLLLDDGVLPERVILVTQNMLQRRVWATWSRHMPEVQAINCPPMYTFLDHTENREKTREKVDLCIGEIERLQRYGETGDIVRQEIPADVLEATRMLRGLPESKLFDHPAQTDLRIEDCNRPWGKYREFLLNAKGTVRILTVHPGQRMSEQRHMHRDELFIPLDDGLRIKIDERWIEPTKDTYLLIPRGQWHRIVVADNIDQPVQVLEVAFGEYDQVGDIERRADDYGRAKTDGSV
ncbi:MAG: ElyC/SanA/YdcF family protein [Planctomycetota bacterium]|jgi:mannose-1-phosphate guanylyltransferase/mannose-6-phosphate isomerase